MRKLILLMSLLTASNIVIANLHHSGKELSRTSAFKCDTRSVPKEKFVFKDLESAYDHGLENIAKFALTSEPPIITDAVILADSILMITGDNFNDMQFLKIGEIHIAPPFFKFTNNLIEFILEDEFKGKIKVITLHGEAEHSEINFTPTIKIYPQGPLTFERWKSVVLNTNVSAYHQVQWNKNGKPIPGATERSFMAKESGSYTVKASIQGRPYISNPVTVEVTPALPTIASISKAMADSGEVVTIKGTDFINFKNLTVGGAIVNDVVVVSDKELQFTANGNQEGV